MEACIPISNTRLKESLSVLQDKGADIKDKEQAAEYFMRFRKRYLYEGIKLQGNLDMLLAMSKQKPIARAMRLKRLESILLKLQRFQSMNPRKMQDIVGHRIIFSNALSMRTFRDMLLSKEYAHMLSDTHRTFSIKKVYDYYDSPQESGYRGVHVVLQEQDNDMHMAFEIQLRTLYQHLWAITVEIADRCLGTHFKQKCSDPVWREFFRMWSRYLNACDDFYIGRVVIASDTKRSMAPKLKELMDKTGVIHMLKDFKPVVEYNVESLRYDSWSLLREYRTGHGHNLFVKRNDYSSPEGSCLDVLRYESADGTASPDVLLCMVQPQDKDNFAYMNYFGTGKAFEPVIEELLELAK